MRWNGGTLEKNGERSNRAVEQEGGSMITFLLGLTLGIIFGVTGLVCVAIMYDKHHPDD